MKVLGSLWIFLVLIPLFGILMFQYNSIIQAKKKKSKVSLLILRGMSIFLLMFLILNPFFEWTKTITLSPEFAVYIDSSKSIENQLKSTNETLDNLVFQIENWEAENGLEINWYTFGDTIKLVTNPKNVKFKSEYTNFSKLPKYLQLQPEKEIILISDGVVTNSTELPNLNFEQVKIHSVGIGIPKTQEDIAISEVDYPKNILSGDSLILNIKIKTILNQNTESTISLLNENNNTIYSKLLSFSSGNSIADLKAIIPFNQLTSKLKLIIDPINEEVDTSNNESDLSLNISNNKENVLFVSGRLSPNSSWIYTALKELELPNIKHLFKTSSDSWNEKPNYIDMSNTKIIVLDNFPSSPDDMILLNKILEMNKVNQTPIAYFEGSNINLNLVNSIFKQLKLEISVEKSKDLQELNMNSFNSKYNNNIVPPLKRSNYINSINQNNNILSYVDNSSALVLYNQMLGIFIPELSKVQLQINTTENKNVLKNIIKRLLSELYFGKENLITLEFEETQFNLNVSINMTVNTHSINNIEDVIINIETSNSKYDIMCSELSKGCYNADFIPFNAGRYAIIAHCLTNNGAIISSIIKEININPINLETELNYLNEIELSNISKNTSGTYVHSTQLKGLLNDLKPQNINKKLKVDFNALTLQNYWWILIILLSLEWFIRKKEGLL